MWLGDRVQSSVPRSPPVDADKSDNRIYYPLHPQRRGDMPWSHWWDDVPKRFQGPHDGQPNALRGKV
ncbi:MAG: hypothetical protein IT384_03760 [Deltaproteobacteria bacterium]|nr:hypothetical protein [Deltaproteobacteria bacterium]